MTVTKLLQALFFEDTTFLMKQIKLTQGFFALVSDEDFERVSQHNWYASIESRGTKVYAKRHCKKHERERWKTTTIRLHHFVLDWVPAEHDRTLVIHHKDDDGLNCTQENLAEITQELNMKLVENWRRKKVEENICL